VSTELDLIVAPRATYAALASTLGTPRTPGALRLALRRPVLVAVVLGVAVALASTRRVSPALVLSTTLAWSYVVVVQIAIALLFVSKAARRTVGLARALDLFFAGHAPWSLFLLAAAAWAPSAGGRPLWPLALAVIAPIVLTPRIVAAYFAEVLGFDRRSARRMAVAQQALTWTVFIAVNWIDSAFTPRVYEMLGR
jgi:hypothetical protein